MYFSIGSSSLIFLITLLVYMNKDFFRGKSAAKRIVGFQVVDSHYDVLGTAMNDTGRLFVRSGLRLVQDPQLGTTLQGTAGKLPSSMIVSDYRGNGKDPVVFISYAGTNGVLAITPFRPKLNAERFQSPAYFLLE